MYNMREQAMIWSLWFNKDNRVEALKVNRKWDLHKETNKQKKVSVKHIHIHVVCRGTTVKRNH